MASLHYTTHCMYASNMTGGPGTGSTCVFRGISDGSDCRRGAACNWKLTLFQRLSVAEPGVHSSVGYFILSWTPCSLMSHPLWVGFFSFHPGSHRLTSFLLRHDFHVFFCRGKFPPELSPEAKRETFLSLFFFFCQKAFSCWRS